MTQLAMGGILNYLAGIKSGPMDGGDLAANLAWPAINGNGIAAATINTNGTPKFSMLGALNAKAGTTGQDINLVCNTLAGTTGLEAVLALNIYAGLVSYA
jgi:hypothetical protein